MLVIPNSLGPPDPVHQPREDEGGLVLVGLGPLGDLDADGLEDLRELLRVGLVQQLLDVLPRGALLRREARLQLDHIPGDD
eukprot:10142338-Alexandrium_andersonii.AAC.1